MQGIAALQAKNLAKFGRKGDTFLAHVAKGETVIPMKVLDENPEIKEALFAALRLRGLNPERYVVGNEFNSINPVTGQPEFFLDDLWDNVKGVLKTAAPLIGAIAGSFIPIPVVGPMLGSFAASMIAGYKPEEALIGAAASGIGAYALGGTAAAAAGGFGSGGTSLGSAIFGGLQQAPSVGAGLSSLVTAAPATTALPAMASGAGFGATAPAAATAASTAAPAAGAAGGIGANLWNFVKTNPGLALAGGSALMSLLDRGEDIKPSLDKGPSANQLLRRNPGAYMINTGKPRVKGYGSAKPQGDYDYARKMMQIPNWQRQHGGPDPRMRFPVVMVAEGGEIVGPGTGTSDDVPAMLSDGEFVMTASAVLGAGGGDRQKGAKAMYKMMKQFEDLNG